MKTADGCFSYRVERPPRSYVSAWQRMSRLLYSLQEVVVRTDTAKGAYTALCQQRRLPNEHLARLPNTYKALSNESPTMPTIPAIPWPGSRCLLTSIWPPSWAVSAPSLVDKRCG